MGKKLDAGKRKLIAPKIRWNGTFELTARRFVRANQWRVRHMLPTEEDSMQRAGQVFATCYESYIRGGKVDNPAWFMALFKTSLANKWNTIAESDKRRRETEAEISSTVEEGLMETQSPDSNLGPLSCDLWSLGQDSEVLRAGKALLAAGKETMDIILDAPTEAARARVAGRFFRVRDPFYIRVILAYARAYRERPENAREGYAIFARLIGTP